MSISYEEIQKENNDRITACFEKYGVFFAFSGEQFKKGLVKIGLEEGKKVTSCGAGMYCKEETVKDFVIEFEKVNEENNDNLKEKVGIENVIKYELNNYESYYTCEIDDAVEALESRGITDIDLIRKVFNEQLKIKIEADEI